MDTFPHEQKSVETIVCNCKHCIRKPQVWELPRLCPETSTTLHVHEFGFWSHSSKWIYWLNMLARVILLAELSFLNCSHWSNVSVQLPFLKLSQGLCYAGGDFMHPALGRKVSGRHPGTGPVMGGGGGPLPHHVPPPPVRTVDKEWKDRVSIHCKK